jgi:hypothetical protein
MQCRPFKTAYLVNAEYPVVLRSFPHVPKPVLLGSAPVMTPSALLIVTTLPYRRRLMRVPRKLTHGGPVWLTFQNQETA